MLHPAKSRVTSPAEAARHARRELRRLARPSGDFDARRYFRGPTRLGFYNVGAKAMRDLARQVYRTHRDAWSVDEAMAFADALMADRHLEVKSVAIEVIARYRTRFTKALLPRWKRWLAAGSSSNWATTDAICGCLIGPLLLEHPALAKEMRIWARHKNMWVRRASVVGLIAPARRGRALDLLYANATTLHADREDLIQKAVGWALREAGKTDRPRLERYLRAHGPTIPRTTLRYAIERFDDRTRRDLLKATRSR
jgi:3-methyladenine DNA glycosylase AlkD